MEIALKSLNQSIKSCEECKDIRKYTFNCVLSKGDPQAPTMIIGEAPGREETEQGIPFVGMAGKILNEALDLCAEANIHYNLYITNAVKCRPTIEGKKNRPPTCDEIVNCNVFLMREINILRPRHIILLGATAYKAITDNPESYTPITKLVNEGCRVPQENISERIRCSSKVYVTYHPAATIYNTGTKKAFLNSIVRILRKCDGTVV